jgi:FAD synthase
MRATIHGKITGPAFAVAGAWDPLTSRHRELFEQLHCEARRNSCSSLVIAIDPDPAILLHGRAEWPVCNDLHTRIRLLLASGIDAVLHVHFHKDDLSRGAREFFDLVTAQVALKELWLGAHQSLGRGPNGSQQTILEIAQQCGIRVQRLPVARDGTAFDVRRSLAAGLVAEIAQGVGLPPIRSRPRSGAVRLAWRPGCYEVAALDSTTLRPAGPRLHAELMPSPSGLPKLAWPDPGIRYLAFVKGPADQ